MAPNMAMSPPLAMISGKVMTGSNRGTDWPEMSADIPAEMSADIPADMSADPTD